MAQSFDVCGNFNMPKRCSKCKTLALSLVGSSPCLDCVLLYESIVTEMKMNFEKLRLETFAKWPMPFIDTRGLAKTGLYYLGQGDLVQCNFCRVKLYEWEGDDNPEEEHRRASPHCEMVNGMWWMCANRPMKLKYEQPPKAEKAAKTPVVQPSFFHRILINFLNRFNLY